jgi:hypothetical protein
VPQFGATERWLVRPSAPIGATCGLPSRPTVAMRPSGWLSRYSTSSSVNTAVVVGSLLALPSYLAGNVAPIAIACCSRRWLSTTSASRTSRWRSAFLVRGHARPAPRRLRLIQAEGLARAARSIAR